MSEFEVMEKAIKTYGDDSQIDKAIEEMSELTKALLKLRHCTKDYERQVLMDAVDEEMADVEIMMCQLGMIFKNQYRMAMCYKKKIERLERRLRNGQ